MPTSKGCHGGHSRDRSLYSELTQFNSTHEVLHERISCTPWRKLPKLTPLGVQVTQALLLVS